MLNIIHKLTEKLDQFKGFSTGYTTKNNKQMLVNIDGVNYKLTIQKLDEGELTFKTVEKHL